MKSGVLFQDLPEIGLVCNCKIVWLKLMCSTLAYYSLGIKLVCIHLHHQVRHLMAKHLSRPFFASDFFFIATAAIYPRRTQSSLRESLSVLFLSFCLCFFWSSLVNNSFFFSLWNHSNIWRISFSWAIDSSYFVNLIGFSCGWALHLLCCMAGLYQWEAQNGSEVPFFSPSPSQSNLDQLHDCYTIYY